MSLNSPPRITILDAVFTIACVALIAGGLTVGGCVDEVRLPTSAEHHQESELVTTTFSCVDNATDSPLDARIKVWLTPTIAAELECVDGITEPRELGLRGQPSVDVTGYVSGDDCPVSPCGWLHFSGPVLLVSPMGDATIDHGGLEPEGEEDILDQLHGIVRFDVRAYR